MKHIFTKGLLLSIVTLSAFAQEKVSFPMYMYSDNGCSKTYFEKARRTNKIVGFGAGAVGIIGSTVMPLSAIFLIGGLGAAAETGYSYIEENEKPDKRKMAPRVRYPIARQYFDITNTLELNKIIDKNKDNDISLYINMYMDAVVNSKKAKKPYKECKSLARVEGVSRSEAKEIEKDIMSFLVSLEEEQDARNLTTLEAAKKNLANCLLEIKVEDTYPIADLLLLRHELANTNLLNWRFKGSVRLFAYVEKMAQKQNKSVSAQKFLGIMSTLDKEKSICSNERKPLNRRKLAQEIISRLE